MKLNSDFNIFTYKNIDSKRGKPNLTYRVSLRIWPMQCEARFSWVDEFDRLRRKHVEPFLSYLFPQDNSRTKTSTANKYTHTFQKVKNWLIDSLKSRFIIPMQGFSLP